MLVALVPTPFHDLPCMGFVLLDISIRQETDVVMDVKVEERAGLSSCFVDDEVVESIVLRERTRKLLRTVRMWDQLT